MSPFKGSKSQVYEPPPRSPHASAALRALRAAPGPSPWYLNGLQIPSSQGPLHWRSAGEESRFAGKSLLTTSGGVAVAISDFHCYVRPVAGHRMLVWYTRQPTLTTYCAFSCSTPTGCCLSGIPTLPSHGLVQDSDCSHSPSQSPQ